MAVILIFLYLLIGFNLVFGLRFENGKPIGSVEPGMSFPIVMSWPIMLPVLAPRITSFTFRGKTLWERKP